jgi:hypothetical protein
MMIGFTAKAAILLPLRFGWRRSRIALDRNWSALAIGEKIGLYRLVSRPSLLAVAARAAKSAAQFFGRPAFFVHAPGMIG